MKIYHTFNVFCFLFILFSAGVISRAQCVPASTAAGALDTCFDGDGTVTTDIGARDDHAYAVVEQPDGKIIVAGVTYGLSSANVNGVLVRYNPDGSLDTTFSGDGIVTTNWTLRSIFSRIALQPDGKIVVAGLFEPSQGDFRFAIWRYNTDGSLDTSFGGGTVFVDSLESSAGASAVAIQPDGKIVASGTRSTGNPSEAVVARLHPNGSLDTSFDADGWTLVSGMRSANAIALQPDGKIVIAGATSYGLGAVGRLNANGSPDTFFGNNGVAIYSYSNMGDEAYGLKIRFDGNIFVGGRSNFNQQVCASLLGFGTDGAVGPNILTCDEVDFKVIAMQTDLKIVTAGWSRNPNWEFAVGRYVNASAIDSTFGTSGKVLVQFTLGNVNEVSTAGAITVQRDNKIVVAGTTAPSGFLSARFAVARLMSGLQAPHAERFDFDGDRKADVSVFRASENKWYVLRSSDGAVAQQIFAIAGDVPVPADYDGDGKTDMAIYRPSSADWWSLSTINGNQVYAHWGQAGVIPRPSDFDGDGKSDYIFFLPSNSTWYRYGSSVGASVVTFGLAGDKPVTGDFDADGKTDVAIYRPSTGDWWYQSSVNGAQLAVHWGISTDIPAAGDYDGDGKTDFAVYRPSTGVWYIINSSNGSFTIINFGLAEDKPVPADYDGDGKVDIAVFRPSTGVWYLLRSTAGFAATQFGLSTDIPTPNAYID